MNCLKIVRYNINENVKITKLNVTLSISFLNKFGLFVKTSPQMNCCLLITRFSYILSLSIYFLNATIAQQTVWDS